VDIELIIEGVRQYWWLIFLIGAAAYLAYSMVKSRADIAELKKKRKELEARKAALEEENKKLDAEYMEHTKKLEEHLKQKDKFLMGGRE